MNKVISLMGPTASGKTDLAILLQKKFNIEIISVDSAGVGKWHVGEPPDRRATAKAKARGIDISSQRARQVNSSDFNLFDYVIAMDQKNYFDLSLLCPSENNRLYKFLQFAPNAHISDVPDPYYGGENGFDDVFDLI